MRTHMANKIYDEITIGIRHELSDYIFKDSIKDFIEKNPKVHLSINLYSKLDIKKYDEVTWEKHMLKEIN